VRLLGRGGELVSTQPKPTAGQISDKRPLNKRLRDEASEWDVDESVIHLLVEAADAIEHMAAALVAVRAEVTRLEKERDESQMWSRYYAVRAEHDRLVTVKEAAEQVIRDYPPHEYGCEWSEYSPSFGALREALAAVSGESQGASDSSPGEEQKTEVGGRQKPPVDDLRELIECFCPNGDHRPGCPHV
jgi:hypothetical protein